MNRILVFAFSLIMSGALSQQAFALQHVLVFQRPILAMTISTRNAIKDADKILEQINRSLVDGGLKPMAAGSEVWSVDTYNVIDGHNFYNFPMTYELRQTKDGIYADQRFPSVDHLAFSRNAIVTIRRGLNHVIVPPGTRRPAIVYTPFAHRIR